jgi:hypothetical protein
MREDPLRISKYSGTLDITDLKLIILALYLNVFIFNNTDGTVQGISDGFLTQDVVVRLFIANL